MTPLTPRVIQIDQVKCAELQAISSDRMDRLLVYFNGYVDGMRRHTVWDERKVAELVDRAVNDCKADPTETVLLGLHAGITIIETAITVTSDVPLLTPLMGHSSTDVRA